MYGYKERKAAQTAAFFTLKSGGSIDHLKLAKLMYLTERECMRRYDEPLFYDRLVSMEHGPVASISLNCARGFSESLSWPEFLCDLDKNEIGIAGQKTYKDLDDLSLANLEILDDLWNEFREFSGIQLRDWTHKNCPEWEDPKGSSNGISHSLVFKFLNKENAPELAKDISAYRNYTNAIESC